MQNIFKWNLLILLICAIFMLNNSSYFVVEEVDKSVKKDVVLLNIGVTRKDFMKEIGKPLDSW